MRGQRRRRRRRFVVVLQHVDHLGAAGRTVRLVEYEPQASRVPLLLRRRGGPLTPP